MIGMRGLSASLVNLQITSGWEEVSICLKVEEGPTEGSGDADFTDFSEINY